MKVLVTGATGLVGVHAVVELLRSGKSVRALVRDKNKLVSCLAPFGVDASAVEIVEGDVTDSAKLPEFVKGCDALVHSAGLFSNKLADKEKINKLNIEGTRALLTEAHGQGLDPMIYLSSYLALFPPEGQIMRSSDQVKSPKEMYASSKAAAERIVRELQDKGAPIVSVYPGSIQGPHDPTYGIGSQMLASAVKTRKMLVTKGGRSFTDVRDLSQLIDKALIPGRGPKRYMFGGYFLSHDECLQILSKTTGINVDPIRIPATVLKVLGSLCDSVSRITGKSFMMTREAAEVLTMSVPTEDSVVINELGLELIGYEQSFKDLFEWMRDTGKIRY